MIGYPFHLTDIQITQPLASQTPKMLSKPHFLEEKHGIRHIHHMDIQDFSR